MAEHGPDPRRSERTSAILGLALAVTFGVCFATGLWSHLVQDPPAWFTPPARPAGLYRITQGAHVATGLASVPLLLAKLWTVLPHLFAWPPVRGGGHALERLGLLPLVGGSVFLLFSGVANIELWYPLPLYFPRGHYWVAWLTIGAMAVHAAVQAPAVRRALDRAAAPAVEVVARRRFLASVAGASAALTAVTVGQTVAPLRRLALLAPRDPDTGPSGFPVNRTVTEAGVADRAADPGWRLAVTGAVARPLSLSRADLEAMPPRDAVLPIACVEGWSASRRWTGVPLAALLALAGAPAGASVTVRSLETGLYDHAELDPAVAADPDTLLALRADGEDLHPDHGYPLRLIMPNRPGVLQTKWLAAVEVHP